eukprot:12629340-Alexandrium_andersonii.AAC.1
MFQNAFRISTKIAQLLLDHTSRVPGPVEIRHVRFDAFSESIRVLLHSCCWVRLLDPAGEARG